MDRIRPQAKLDFAKRMRANASAAEQKLWEQLRDRRLAGFKFSRQAPIGPFIADFACRAEKLIVEVDGPAHEETAEQDARRTRHLESQGHRVIRFRNDEVLDGIEGVLRSILETLKR